MRIARIKIDNFRGISRAEFLLPEHAVLVGDNNTGKSTVLEAIDLVLGPERLARRPPIDEHDFYAGEYIGSDENPVSIAIEVVVVGLSEEQARHFRNNLEWWEERANALLDGPPPERTDQPGVVCALRVGFTGLYDKEEDDFTGSTYFLSPTLEDGSRATFKTSDKRLCGFLFLRTLRTGSRALSLERGSLLDIILRLQDERLDMWEDVLKQLRTLAVAENQELGITAILESVQSAVRSFVPSDWANNPRIRVSDLTREHLRKTLTVFMDTGAKRQDDTEYAAPFQHQGTGTINILVLALLSMIANLKQNVIFAMEEPEIAIPPHTQKRIVDSIRKMSAQSLFTSHSPYVLEEFPPSQVLLLRRANGVLHVTPTTLPPTVKSKAYRSELRKRFCECLLASRILIVEGRTEYDAYPVAARRLHELESDRFKTLESLGIAVIDAQTDSQIVPLGTHFASLGKTVFAVFDKQDSAAKAVIDTVPMHAYEAPEMSFEKMLLNGTAETALRRFALSVVAENRWPSHLMAKKPTDTMTLADLRDALSDYLKKFKGSGEAADLLAQCDVAEMPSFIVETLEAIQLLVVTPPVPAETKAGGDQASDEELPPTN